MFQVSVCQEIIFDDILIKLCSAERNIASVLTDSFFCRHSDIKMFSQKIKYVVQKNTNEGDTESLELFSWNEQEEEPGEERSKVKEIPPTGPEQNEQDRKTDEINTLGNDSMLLELN